MRCGVVSCKNACRSKSSIISQALPDPFIMSECRVIGQYALLSGGSMSIMSANRVHVL